MNKKSIQKSFVLIPACLFFFPIFLTAAEKNQPITHSGDRPARQNILRFFQYEKKVNLNAKILDKENEPGYTRERIVFNGADDAPVYGYLALPSKKSPPFPVVLQAHYLKGSKYDWWKDDNFIYGGNLTKKLIKAGFAVLSLNSKFSRLFDFHTKSGQPDPAKALKKQLQEKIQLIINSTSNYRLAIDYLQTRKEIDTSKIGVIGYSIGSIVALQLTAVDHRIKTAVLCVIPAIRDVVNSFNLNFDFLKDYLYVIDPLNFSPLLSNKSILMLMGDRDGLCSKKEAGILFDSIDVPGKKIIFFNRGHFLPKDYIDKVAPWFVQYLKAH
jgi:hypothetical protein